MAVALTERLVLSALSRRTDPVRVSPIGLRDRLCQSSAAGLQHRLPHPTR